MKRMMTLLLAAVLAFVLSMPAVAENAVPAEVQAFYDAIDQEAQSRGLAPATAEIVYAEDYLTYVKQEDVALLTALTSRARYDSFYYWYAAENLLVTVAYLGDQPAAYIIDGPIMQLIAGRSPYYQSIMAFMEGYAELFPADRENFYIENLLFTPALESTSDNVRYVLHDKVEYDDMLVSVFKLNFVNTFIAGMEQDVFSIQFQPCAAYENGMDGALENHQITYECMMMANVKTAEAILESMK